MSCVFLSNHCLNQTPKNIETCNMIVAWLVYAVLFARNPRQRSKLDRKKSQEEFTVNKDSAFICQKSIHIWS